MALRSNVGATASTGGWATVPRPTRRAPSPSSEFPDGGFAPAPPPKCHFREAARRGQPSPRPRGRTRFQGEARLTEASPRGRCERHRMADLAVVIPTFRRPKELQAAVESVLAQRVGVEVVVVDDSPEQ